MLMPMLLPFENGIPGLLYTPVQEVNEQVADVEMDDVEQGDEIDVWPFMGGGYVSDLTDFSLDSACDLNEIWVAAVK